jgi:uncharacterized protein YbcC (UPF0753/DUF2309 family)
MPTEDAVRVAVETAGERVAPVWPLHSFVTANPLAGFEDRPFHEAVACGERLFGGRGYPRAETFRHAWKAGEIAPDPLAEELAAGGYDAPPAELLDRMATDESVEPSAADGPAARVDAVLTKWLAAFFDQGRAEWAMPNREAGFYTAFRTVARHDGDIPDRGQVADLPDDPVAAVATLLDGVAPDRLEAVVESHLAALPGWTGLVRRRSAADDEWADAAPATLAGYLAARLALTDAFDAPLAPPVVATPPTDPPLHERWLAAWERSYRTELVDAVTARATAREDEATGDEEPPAAQLVFCIDTRSEVVRRHVEAAGPYETYGYAGFFGIPMQYEGYDAAVAVDACPPVVDTGTRVRERPVDECAERRADHDRWTSVVDVGHDLVKTLTANAVTTFSFVESAGAGYGAALAGRTLAPGRVGDLLRAVDDRVPDVHEFCAPVVERDPAGDGALPAGLSLDERVECAAAAFELTGWTEFARVVTFVGHASETANNPFESSLNCGACAGNPGGPNARVLAAICNEDAVRERLRDRGVDVPDDTVFVAGEHTTTTDEVTLYDAGVPASHEADLARLRADLADAGAAAAAERTASMAPDAADGVRETRRRAADWAEPRPEWGLAGNAALVVGPRRLTEELNLDGRVFLHSYDPSTDPDGSTLAAVVNGPLVVTQWINSQYYFSTVDNAAYGSGSKTTQNPVGNVGVYQGNGGDLAAGLPLQSVRAADETPYHRPLRLSAVIYAPVERVTEVLADAEAVATLLDNGWLSLTVVDPADSRARRYDGDLTWTGVETPDASAETPLAPTVED